MLEAVPPDTVAGVFCGSYGIKQDPLRGIIPPVTPKKEVLGVLPE
jgi:hypothetical protein